VSRLSTDERARNRIVVDANVLIGAAIGRSRFLLNDLADRATVVVPIPQLDEVKAVLAHKGIDGDVFIRSLLAIVQPVPAALLAPFEEQARGRLEEGGQPDWPVLATALALDADIWSRDRDFFGVGVPVWHTRNIKYAACDAAETENHA
jgi:predicted nucleic acid-binding protein